ncbi:MAG: PilZ domain-containing protein [Sedimenticolaceae bacterium]
MQDRRLFPRYSFSSPVELRSRQGGHFDAQTSEISSVGIGLLMARTTVVALAQGGPTLTTGDQFELIVAGAADPYFGDSLRVGCRVGHVRRLSKEQYLVGALYADPSPAQEAEIAALVERARPKVFR